MHLVSIEKGVSKMTTHTPDETDAGTSRSSDTDAPAPLAGSRVVSVLRFASTRGGSWVRQSALYQWLTAEPDPDVIVIDLRETWTVGPFLAVLDWLINRLVGAAADSRAVGVAQRGASATRAAPLRAAGLMFAVFGLVVAGSGLLGSVSMTRLAVGIGLGVGGLVAMRDDRDWTTLRETRVVTLLIAALEPPEPPETADQEGATQHSLTELSQDDDRETADSQQER